MPNAKVSDGWPHHNIQIASGVLGQPFAPLKGWATYFVSYIL